MGEEYRLLAFRVSFLSFLAFNLRALAELVLSLFVLLIYFCYIDGICVLRQHSGDGKFISF